VAGRSEAWVLAGWLLGSWVRIPLKALMFFLSLFVNKFTGIIYVCFKKGEVFLPSILHLIIVSLGYESQT
jgi:hypothetical protein